MTSFASGLQIGPPLGAGHFGEVYRGTDPIHCDVAVKIFKRLAEDDDDVWLERRADLLAEGQMLAAADHDKVVRVFRVEESEDRTCIALVMQWCEEGSLLSAYEKGPMTTRETRDTVTSASLGLQALHQRGLLHRDIKPANLLRARNGDLKIGDFGLVTDRLVLGYGSRAGYLDHVAFEIHFSRGTSEKSDIWALGMTTYRLLHGATWYRLQNLDPGDQIPNGGFAQRLPWLPHVPDAWRRFIRATMNDDSSKRIPTAVEFLRRLAVLPVSPVWSCTVSSESVHWIRHLRSGRSQQVDWTWTSSKKHHWVAMSLPGPAGGRALTLGTSGGTVGQLSAISGLKAFFESQKG